MNKKYNTMKMRLNERKLRQIVSETIDNVINQNNSFSDNEENIEDCFSWTIKIPGFIEDLKSEKKFNVFKDALMDCHKVLKSKKLYDIISKANYVADYLIDYYFDNDFTDMLLGNAYINNENEDDYAAYYYGERWETNYKENIKIINTLNNKLY